MKNFFKFTYTPGEPVLRERGQKTVLLDQYKKWALEPGVEYIIHNFRSKELDKCIIVQDGSFLRVSDIPCKVVPVALSILSSEVSYRVNLVREFQGNQISLEQRSLRFSIDGSQEEDVDLGLLPSETQELISQWREYRRWIISEGLEVFSAEADFRARRGFCVIDVSEQMRVDTTHGSGGLRKVSAVKLQNSVYQAMFMGGHAPEQSEADQVKVKHLATLKLEESGLSYSFQPIWMSPTMQAGYLTVDGQKLEGLIQMPGNGKGSYLTAALRMQWFEQPPILMQDMALQWIERGGSVCWGVPSKGDSDGYNHETIWEACNIPADVRTKEEPVDPTGWVLVYNTGTYLYDPSWSNTDYLRLVEESRLRTVAWNAYLAKGGSSHSYVSNAVAGGFETPEVPTPDDFKYEVGWSIGTDAYSYGPVVGVSGGRGYRSTGYHYKMYIQTYGYEGLKYEAQFASGIGEGLAIVVPLDGSGIYLRVPSESPVRRLIEISEAIAAHGVTTEDCRDARWYKSYYEKYCELVQQVIAGTVMLGDLARQAATLRSSVAGEYDSAVTSWRELKTFLSTAIEGLNTRYIGDQISEINTMIEQVWAKICAVDYAGATSVATSVRAKIAKLAEQSGQTVAVVTQRATDEGIPTHLLEAFGGDIDRAIQFRLNVQMLPTNRLDSHEITCGRSRVTSHIDAIWVKVPGATGDFWCGADANDVKHFVYNYHLGSGDIDSASSGGTEAHTSLQADTIGDLFAGMKGMLPKE
jgi:hypothetical protein